jgi:hypothetical protein
VFGALFWLRLFGWLLLAWLFAGLLAGLLAWLLAWLIGLLFGLLLALLLAWLLAVVFLFEGADGWLAGLLLFAAAAVDACFAAGVDAARACFGDMAGALYGAPADLAATTPFPWNSPGLAVAAIAGRPWFADAKFCLFWLARCS